jgi:hypothetical protein
MAAADKTSSFVRSASCYSFADRIESIPAMSPYRRQSAKPTLTSELGGRAEIVASGFRRNPKARITVALGRATRSPDGHLAIKNLSDTLEK